VAGAILSAVAPGPSVHIPGQKRCAAAVPRANPCAAL